MLKYGMHGSDVKALQQRRAQLKHYPGPAGWVTVPLGQMYDPVFFIGTARAIHGSSSVPLRPVSHGCVRIPMDIAAFFHTEVKVPGTPVVAPSACHAQAAWRAGAAAGDYARETGTIALCATASGSGASGQLYRLHRGAELPTADRTRNSEWPP